jgi:hypothetical protein
VTNEDREHFALLIDSLAASFGVEPTTALKLGYWMGLKDLAIADIETAIDRALRQNKFMPKPVELRELAGEMSPQQRAVLAWDAARRALHQNGTYVSVDFDDPLINAAIRSCGGWQQLGMQDGEEFEKWTSQKFQKNYVTYLLAGTSRESMQHLAGKHEIENGARGFELEPPRQVATGLPQHRADVLARLGDGRELILQLPERVRAMQ